MFDEGSQSPPYRLGMLFALLEDTQALALGKVGAGIRDKYFASASAMPARTFPILLKGYVSHISKIRRGRGVGCEWCNDPEGLAMAREQKVRRTIDEFRESWPRLLNLEQQAVFMVGYFHQRHDLLKRNDSAKSDGKRLPPDGADGQGEAPDAPR